MKLSERVKLLSKNATTLDFLENSAGFVIECIYNTRRSANEDYPIIRCEKKFFLEDALVKYTITLDLFQDNSWCVFANEDAIDVKISFTEDGVKEIEKEAESIIRANILSDILNKINRSKKKYDSLYLMQDTKNKELKIGRSHDVKSRRRSVSSQRGTKCVVLFEIPKLGDHEEFYHSMFYKQRIGGEWFSYSDLITNKFQELYKYHIFSKEVPSIN